MASAQVRVGGTDYALRPFKAFKALVAGDLISGVGEETRLLLAKVREFERDYGKTNVVRFTKAQCAQRGWNDLPDSAFVEPEGGEPYIDLPGSPSSEELMMFGFPEAFRLARTEVAKLLALIVIPDEELRVSEAGDGGVDAALDALGQRLVHEGEIGEIIALLAAAVEHARAQLSAHREDLGKLRSAWSSMTAGREEDREPDERKRTIEPMTVVSGSDSSSPGSSTGSPGSTGGPETPSSTELTGASSST